MTKHRPSIKRMLAWGTLSAVAIAAVVLAAWRPSTPNNPREMVFTLAVIMTSILVAVWVLTRDDPSKLRPMVSRVLLLITAAFFVYIGATAAITGRSWEHPGIHHPSGTGEGLARIIFGLVVFVFAAFGPKLIKRLAHNPVVERPDND